MMGTFMTKLFEALNRVEARIIMLGLDGAGKTTILYKWSLGQTLRPIPTIGFNVESVGCKGVGFTVWDIGGQYKIRSLWKHYFKNTNGNYTAT